MQCQYATSEHLDARIAFHGRFRTNPLDLHRWLFERFDAPPQASILEIGGGTGELWRKNLDRLPSGWKVTLTDASEGMVSTCRSASGDLPQFSFAVVDADALPYPDASFDLVVADHMLYYASDRPRTFREMRRVLKHGGTLFATTKYDRDMAELKDMTSTVIGWFADWWDQRPYHAFTIENGREQLASVFSSVELRMHRDSLAVTEAEPLVGYIRSLVLDDARMTDAVLAKLRTTFETRIRDSGSIRITKDVGLFIAR